MEEIGFEPRSPGSVLLTSKLQKEKKKKPMEKIRMCSFCRISEDLFIPAGARTFGQLYSMPLKYKSLILTLPKQVPLYLNSPNFTFSVCKIVT